MGVNGMGAAVCVTGAGGYIASWLVKTLLAKGYVVHGTARDPSDRKNAHLRAMAAAKGNYLKIFKADLLDYDSLLAAIAGCAGVFHAASPVPLGELWNPDAELIEPAVRGTLNVLRACSEAKVRRAVVVSSVAAASFRSDWPKEVIMDEGCWSDKELCKTNENWYYLAKTMAEEEALAYSERSGLDVVTVLPSLVLGPLLQPTVNASSRILINLLKGEEDPTENRMWQFVDVRDVADALLIAYERSEAAGRYICSSYPMLTVDFVGKLRSMYPNFKYPGRYADEAPFRGTMSSEKLKRLGWKPRALEETIADSVEFYLGAGLVDELQAEDLPSQYNGGGCTQTRKKA